MLTEITKPNDVQSGDASELAGMTGADVLRLIQTEMAEVAAFNARKFRRLADLLRHADRLGVDTSGLVLPFLDRVRAIAHGVVTAEAAYLTLNSERAFRVVSQLHPTVQTAVAERGAIEAVTAAGPAAVPLSAVTDAVLKRALDPATRTLLPLEKQRAPRPYTKGDKRPERVNRIVVELSNDEYDCVCAEATAKRVTPSALLRAAAIDAGIIKVRPRRRV